MLRAPVCLLAAILGAADWLALRIVILFLKPPMMAFHTTQPIFTYKTLSSIFRRNADDCKICYGHHDCMTMDKARCEYYMEVQDVLHERGDDEDDVKPAMKETVDAMLFDIVEKANPVDEECIPYISEYTDCTKENVCTGCKRCSCDGQGEWNCSVVQRCRADGVFNLDHRVLISVMESLSNFEFSYRTKREVTDAPTTTKMMFDISEWLYGVKNMEYNTFDTEPKENNNGENNNIVNDEINSNGSTVNTVHTTTPKDSEHQSDIDYLAFDEVLNNIAVDTKNYTRRKPALDVGHNETDIDYMLMEDINVTTNNANVSDQFMNMLHIIEGIEADTEAPIEGVTKVLIDLLESAKSYKFKFNETDYMNVDNKINSEYKQPFDNTNSIEDFNVINVMKRDVSNVSDVTEASTTIIDNITESAQELKDNVLQPLANIISDKEKELQELIRVKENLMTFMKSYNNGDIEMNFKNNKTENNSNTYFSIYKMEIIPQFDYDLRKKNPEILDKYLYILKRDIYEVIKDIVGIRKLSDNVNIPEELKVLVRAMRYYIRKDKKGDTESKILNTRRHYNPDIFKLYPQSSKDCILEIFAKIDKDMPEANALSSLSQTAKKIMQRIIKNHYIDEFKVIGLRDHNISSNLTSELTSIGNDWQKVATDVLKSSLNDQLYAMKLLHLILSVDISKLTDALTLINFHHSRRHLDVHIGDNVIKQIHESLQTINNKINFIVGQKQNQRIVQHEEVDETNKQKQIVKDSFLKQLRKLFKNSKNDIISLLKKKVPKSEIVKELAKKKLTDLTRRKLAEYEEVMKRWQYNLDIVPKRYKRSSIDGKKKRREMKNRIKNIIPKYLRGKISPAIVAIDSKKVTKKSITKKHIIKTSATTIKSEIKSKRLKNVTKTK